ncbi:uncharacterized protein QC763_0105140 [Podospora pseudopauciseta]|uniref:Uncharacterized protein n=1 Tax=Podospora pseudopauciseta TaxID=2093780 RepID=A0ABR0H189_9PEZI|nr:hypothetical protein QC763_0105140 [Podospora pseudopauciseta]
MIPPKDSKSNTVDKTASAAGPWNCNVESLGHVSLHIRYST